MSLALPQPWECPRLRLSSFHPANVTRWARRHCRRLHRSLSSAVVLPVRLQVGRKQIFGTALTPANPESVIALLVPLVLMEPNPFLDTIRCCSVGVLIIRHCTVRLVFSSQLPFSPHQHLSQSLPCTSSSSVFGSVWLVYRPSLRSKISLWTTLTHGSYTATTLIGFMRRYCTPSSIYGVCHSQAKADVVLLQSDATNDRYNGSTSWQRTSDSRGSASFKFNGTAIYFMSYGKIYPEPDMYQVTVDGRNETGSLRVDHGNESAQFIAYSQTGLDASQEHQIIIKNIFGIDLNIDAFM